MGSTSAAPTLDPSNPWGNNGSENSADNEGWANFDSSFGGDGSASLDSQGALTDAVPVENKSSVLPSKWIQSFIVLSVINFYVFLVYINW